MHNGPSTQTARSLICCGGEPQVVTLTRQQTPGCRVELVRCRGCGRGSWLLDGAVVDSDAALAALSAAYSPAPSRTTKRDIPSSRRAEAPSATASEAPVELAELLAGWKVHGTST